VSRWIKDLFAENVMAKMQISFVVSKISMSQIDFKESSINRARVHGVDQTLVDEYYAAMLRGDAFPMIVVRKKRGNWYVIAGGNHRAQAAKKAGYREIECYVIDIDDMQFDALAKASNGGHGKGLPLSERIDSAVDMAIRWKMSAADAAEINNVTAHQVQDKLRVREVLTLAHKNDIPVKASDTAVEKLAGLAKSDQPVLLAALKSMQGRVITTEDTTRLRSELSECKSESEKLEAVEKWAKDNGTLKLRKAIASPLKAKACRATKDLKSVIMTAQILQQTQMQKSDAEAMLQELESMTLKLQQLLALG